MAKKQTVTVRVTDEVKAMFQELAKENSRSQANMFEVLVKEAYINKEGVKNDKKGE